MADAIDVLLGEGLDVNADMGALAKQLRGERDLGRFMSLSTIPQVSKLGASQISSAQAAAQRGGVIRGARRKEAESKRRYEAGVLTAADERKYKREQDKLERQLKKERYSSEYKDRLREQLRRESVRESAADKRETARQAAEDRRAGRTEQAAIDREERAKRREERARKRPPVSIQKEVKTAGGLLTRSERILQMLKDNPEAIEQGTDIGISLARKLPFIGSELANVLEQEYKTLDERGVRTGMSKLIAEIRHSLTGAQLTRFEIADSERWHPMAAGITHEEAVQRMGELMEAGRISRDEKMSGYDWNDEDSRAAGLRGKGVEKPPSPTAIQVGVPAGAEAVETRILDGKRYIRMPGGDWQAAD